MPEAIENLDEINEMQNVSAKEFHEDDLEIKTEIEHVLSRPGTWVGSINTDLVNYPLYVPSKNKIQVLSNIGYNAGLLKLIDEIISNSVDEHRHNNSMFNLNKISVSIHPNGLCRIEDNGGIGVKKHPKYTKFLRPELMFGHLRTSTNYNDTMQRNKVGTNGLGSKLTNIFSTEFSVETHDSTNGVILQWSNNMGEIAPYTIFPSKEHKTITTFKIDLKRFQMEEIPSSVIRIVQKRCIDAAATNPGLEVNFKSPVFEGKLDSSWKFNNFKEYVDLFLEKEQRDDSLHFRDKKYEVIIVPEDIGVEFSFVNGAMCSQGTHVNKIRKTFNDNVLDICHKMEMEHLNEKDINNRTSIFINTTVMNPTYDSQTKEKLNNRFSRSELTFNSTFLKNLKNTKIIEILKDYYDIKYAEIKKKETKKLNGTLKVTKSKKLIKCAANSSDLNELWLFEGTSASNGFRKVRNLYQSAYLLRGKIRNTFNLQKSLILENTELREVIAALGILFENGNKNLKICNYNKIIIATDMDPDGNHICGLFIAFFGKFFPELIKSGRVYRALSPIIIAEKNKVKKYYLTLDEFHAEEKNLKGWDILYTKGLGGLADEDYVKMVRQQHLLQFTMDDLKDMETLNIWFDKSTNQRKEVILADGDEIE